MPPNRSAPRLEALYSVAPYDDPKATVLADFAHLNALDNCRNAAGVTARVELETSDVKAGGRSLRLHAANAGDSPPHRRSDRWAGRTSTPISACCPATPWACGSKATAAARC